MRSSCASTMRWGRRCLIASRWRGRQARPCSRLDVGCASCSEQESADRYGRQAGAERGYPVACLATEAVIIAAMTFVSRQDVDAIRQQMHQPFFDAQEICRRRHGPGERSRLRSSSTDRWSNHLVSTARGTAARMLNYQFFEPLPSAGDGLTNSLQNASRLRRDARREQRSCTRHAARRPAKPCPALRRDSNMTDRVFTFRRGAGRLARRRYPVDADAAVHVELAPSGTPSRSCESSRDILKARCMRESGVDERQRLFCLRAPCIPSTKSGKRPVRLPGTVLAGMADGTG